MRPKQKPAWLGGAFGCVVAVLVGVALVVHGQARRTLFEQAPGSPFAVGAGPTDLAVADLDRDGKLDFVTADQGGNTLSVLLGDGRGGFRNAPGSPFDAGPKPHLVAAGDFNADRIPDLVVTEHDSNGVRVFLGAGRVRFTAAPGSPFVALRGTRPHNHGLALGDLNGDGKLDVTTANHNAGSVSALLGDGQGDFVTAAGSPFAVGRGPYPHALGDLNGDGRLDIVTPNVASNDVTVLLGDGKAGFHKTPGALPSIAKRPYSVALGDLDGDGNLDVVTTHDDVNLVTVLLGDGRGGFRQAPGSPVDAGYRAGELVVGDFNGDTRLDLAMGTAGDNVVVLLGDGQGRFAPAPGSPFAVGRGPWDITAADVNADGKLDLLTANFESGNVTVLLGK